MRTKDTDVKQAISCVIFDLGNVILFFDHLKMASKISNLTGRNPENDFRTVIEDESWQIFEKGFMSPKIFYNKFLSLLKLSPNDIDFNSFKQYFNNIFYPNKAMITLIKDLKKTGTRLILLSNTNELHYEFIKKNFPIVNIFDAHVLSYKEGRRKPEQEIFRKAIRVAGCKAENILYIDDISKYTEVASDFGIKTLTYDSKRQDRLLKYDFIPWYTTSDPTV